MYVCTVCSTCKQQIASGNRLLGVGLPRRRVAHNSPETGRVSLCTEAFNFCRRYPTPFEKKKKVFVTCNVCHLREKYTNGYYNKSILVIISTCIYFSLLVNFHTKALFYLILLFLYYIVDKGNKNYIYSNNINSTNKKKLTLYRFII